MASHLSHWGCRGITTVWNVLNVWRRASGAEYEGLLQREEACYRVDGLYGEVAFLISENTMARHRLGGTAAARCLLWYRVI